MNTKYSEPQSTEILYWMHEVDAQLTKPTALVFECKLSPPLEGEEDFSLFEVICILEILHPTIGLVFNARTKSVFRLHNWQQKPEKTELFAYVEKANAEFVKLFETKTSDTPLTGHSIQPPDPAVIEKNITQCIHSYYG